jgi:hypothetical protein
MKGHYFSKSLGKYTPISDAAYAAARARVQDGFISTSSKFRHVSRPVGDFTNYGYEWHARCSGETVELDVEMYTAFREVATQRCGQCGQTDGKHTDGCAYLAQSKDTEITTLRSKLCAATAEIAELRAQLAEVAK